MKQIYFVMTDTGTILSKIVKHFMKDEYGHVSISLDKDLTKEIDIDFTQLEEQSNRIIFGDKGKGVSIGDLLRAKGYK